MLDLLPQSEERKPLYVQRVKQFEEMNHIIIKHLAADWLTEHGKPLADFGMFFEYNLINPKMNDIHIIISYFL